MNEWDVKRLDLLREFQSIYHSGTNSEALSSEDKEIMKMNIQQTANILDELIQKHLKPKCHCSDNQEIVGMRLPITKINIPMGVVTNEKVKEKKTRKKSDWQIFLIYANQIIPNYSESKDKTKLLKNHYRSYTADQRQELRGKYYEDYPDND